MARTIHRRRSRGARSRRAGFTLVELMVALTIAAIVIATIYTLVGASAQNFHEQQRVGQTQLATRLALDRLRRDIERAGLHGTPDSRLERTFGATGPRILAVQLTHNDVGSRTALTSYQAAADNTTDADRLVLTGNYTTSDAFLVRGLNGAGTTAFLQVSWQGFRRAFANFNDPNTYDVTVFGEVFRTGRMLHLTMVNGTHYFVTVTGANIVGTGATAQAQVDFSPGLPIGTIGVGGLAEGATIAPLTTVTYSLAQPPPDLPPADFGDVAVTGPNTALVRSETDVGGTLITPPRTVLEYAVHFDVDAIFDTSAAPGSPPVLTFFDDAQAQTRMGANPARVRALVVEIGARTPDQDPGLPWVARASGGPLTSFRVFSDRPGSARVRTGRLEIGMPNLVYRGL